MPLGHLKCSTRLAPTVRAGALGAFAIDIGGSGTNDELILSIGPSSVSIFNGAPLDTNDNTGGLNTIRISQPANSTEFLIWRDGVQIADLKQGIFTDPPTLFWGDPSGSNYGGPTIHVGYARWDDTGAYSPPGFLPGDLNHDGAVNAARLWDHYEPLVAECRRYVQRRSQQRWCRQPSRFCAVQVGLPGGKRGRIRCFECTRARRTVADCDWAAGTTVPAAATQPKHNLMMPRQTRFACVRSASDSC